MDKAVNPKDAIGSTKLPMSVVPANVLAEMALGMLEGALKYGRHNWRDAGVRYSIYYDAALRHLMAFWEGEDNDPDSQLSHITKAICGLVVLRDSMMQGNAIDDRPPAAYFDFQAASKLAGSMVNVDKALDNLTAEMASDMSTLEQAALEAQPEVFGVAMKSKAGTIVWCQCNPPHTDGAHDFGCPVGEILDQPMSMSPEEAQAALTAKQRASAPETEDRQAVACTCSADDNGPICRSSPHCPTHGYLA